MKKNLLLLLFVIFTGHLFGQKTTIEWEGNKIMDYGTFQYNLPFFKNENYSVINGVPYLTFSKKEKESSQYDIKNLVWEKIPAKEVFGLLADNVSTKEIAYSNSQKQTINGQFLTNVVIATIKKDKNTLYRLTSFELVKKTVNNQRTSRTSDLIGTTENPLKSGNFYKIKVDKSGIFKITTKFLRDNGINPSSINPKNFRIYGNGGLMLPEFNQDFRYAALQENAIQVIGEEDGKWDENDYALFYAQGPHGYNLYNVNNGSGYKRNETRLTHISDNSVNIYENFSYYFINFDKGEGKRVTLSDIAPSSKVYTRYDDYQFINEEKTNFLNIGRLWVGDAFNANKSVSFTTKTAIKPTDTVKIKSSVYVKNATNDKITYSINGQNSSSFTVSNSPEIKIKEIPWETSASNLSGTTLKIDYTLESSNPLVAYYLDYAEVQYKQDLVYNDAQMNFRVF